MRSLIIWRDLFMIWLLKSHLYSHTMSPVSILSLKYHTHPPQKKNQADFGIITGLFILKLTYKACSLLRNLLICTCIHSYQCYMLKIMKFMTILKLYTYINPYNKKCKYSQEICKHYLSTCKRWQNTHMVLLSFTKCCRWVWGNEYG